MKKTIIVLGIVFLLIIGMQLIFLYDLVPYKNIFSNDPVHITAQARGREIFLNDGQSETAFKIKGVLLDSCLPGYYSNDFKPDETVYLRWLEQISQMGANTICLHSRMDSEFYKALLAFNTGRADPLYIIQGVSVPDYNLNNAKDSYDAYYDKLLEDAKDTVDAIHGAIVVTLGRVQSSGNYINDVSSWTLGYVLGMEWVPYTLAYTDNKGNLPQSYSGRFYYTDTKATPSEVMFAQIMDELSAYELRRYNSLSMLALANATATDPLYYNEDVIIQLEKHVTLNASHIIPTDEMSAGCFSAYYIRGEMEDFKDCIGDTDWQNYGEILTKTNFNTVYGGYIDFLAKLHEMPLIIYYGFSSSRGSDETEPPLTELEQGQTMMKYYYDFMSAGCQGAVISTWQDNWSNSTWNTMHAVDTQQEKSWLDVQTVNNCYGLLSFDPGKEKRPCYVDGKAEEWKAKDIVYKDKSLSLSVKYDFTGLYLMISGTDFKEPLYLPFDICSELGSNWAEDYAVRFERFADFLLKIDSPDDVCLLVQKRYDAAYMRYEERISGVNAFDYIPNIHSASFVPIRHVLQNSLVPDAGLEDMNVEERAVFNRYGVRETGKLRRGNADPSSPKYDSLADYCYGDACLEIRIPWQLLNFSNPSEMKIHKDYYPLYGVEETKVKRIYIGLARQDSDKIISMPEVAVKGWNNSLEYHERLKQSYYVVQTAWRGGS